MFKIERGVNYTLPSLARQFYKKINPINKNGAHKKNSLEKRLKKIYLAEKDPLQKRFFKELYANNYRNLKTLIKGTPSELSSLMATIDALLATTHIPAFYEIKKGAYSSTPFGTKVLKLFDYTACRGSIKFVWFVEELGIDICPYCNYEYTFKIKRASDEILLHDIDHFISKVTYPYLSLSFFNLVPSCHPCNSTLKGSKQFLLATHVHPYVDDLHSFATFTIDKPILSSDLTAFSVQLNPKTTDPDKITKLDNHKAVFEIEPRYNHFKKDLIRLDGLKADYPESYKQELLTKGINGRVFKTRDDLINYIGKTIDVPTNAKSASQTSRGKFKMDLAIEFELIT
jgi:hypothetical protein